MDHQESLLHTPVKMVKGIGEARAKGLTRLGISTLGDLLTYFPRDYEDRTLNCGILSAAEGTECVVCAVVAAPPAITRPRRNLSIARVLVSDGDGFMTLVWFNQEYQVKNLVVGQQYWFFGTLKRNGTKVEMHGPVFEPADGPAKNTNRIMPVYRLSKGISQTLIRNAVQAALNLVGEKLEDPIPEALRQHHQLIPYTQALHEVHFPSDGESAVVARRRLVFEELLMLQLGLIHVKGSNRRQVAEPMAPVDLKPLLSALPFQLTDAQARVVTEIDQDLAKPVRMNRLVQGDVGSGKTVIAFAAIYRAVRNGFQCAFMVPTEILAEQHAKSAAALFDVLGIRYALLTGGCKKKEKDRIRAALLSGELDVVIGTHAVLEADVVFHRLGLVVTDEQHRFGVRQRAVLGAKGASPHMLVMTATPIPRTLALILYGDLDISVIDSLPPGRKPIKTYAVDDTKRVRIYTFIRKLVGEGRQAYIVCPLVEESEEMEAESATELAERIRDEELAGISVGLIHGRMKSADKDAAMRSFVSGETAVLVSTTVIEVGVNVPNAVVMVVENAERFGLAQLHQLRGRVGRGAEQSYCILFNQSRSTVSKERMNILTQSTDGFVISEKDMELRGPGDLFGIRQHGLPEFRIANLYRDMDILKEVQEAAREIIHEERLTRDPGYHRLHRNMVELFRERLKEITLN